jgi:hypothetical protein
MKIRLIGDVHGKYDSYLPLLDGCDDSIQLGDFGFDYYLLTVNDPRLNPDHHKVLPGNHDNYDDIPNHKNFLGDFGTYKNVFYIRGGFSIDWMWRQRGVSYWHEEEMDQRRLEECIEAYCILEPETVISHECPVYAAMAMYGHDNIMKPSRTSEAMNKMLIAHQPKFWYFAHHHRSWKREVCNTQFQCLAELETVDIET